MCADACIHCLVGYLHQGRGLFFGKKYVHVQNVATALHYVIGITHSTLLWRVVLKGDLGRGRGV